MDAAPLYDETGRALLLFDGECPLCRKSVALLKRLDWIGVLRFHNAREPENLPDTRVALDATKLLEQMHLVTPERDQVYVGFEAFRWMAWRLPLLAAFAPLLWMPGAPILGRRAYLWVARNRFRLAPCREGVCSVPQSDSSSANQKN